MRLLRSSSTFLACVPGQKILPQIGHFLKYVLF